MSLGWFAEYDAEQNAWVPCIQCEGSLVLVLGEIYFTSAAGCERWIQDNIIGKGWVE